jgi:hypothetical protein
MASVQQRWPFCDTSADEVSYLESSYILRRLPAFSGMFRSVKFLVNYAGRSVRYGTSKFVLATK